MYFESLEGVKEAISGYAGGNYPNPTYETVLKYRTSTPNGLINHTESVKVVYDDEKISTRELIKKFWELHDPTQKNRQGNDIGNNYRSAIYYTNNKQKEIAFETKDEYQKALKENGYGEITTEIKPLDKFYEAEEYHQNYLKKNPFGYCPNHATGVKFKETSNKSIKPLGGKEIIVIDSNECPYCKKFKKDVINGYKGDIPLIVTKANSLEEFDIKSGLDVTPTIRIYRRWQRDF